ncbi:MAG: ABC transporter ATP-binding protein/permease [Candidatus Cloacimonetes bacterium]|nr:ABC transporter ATP-binding protein/permease [Candidatus Cloacimonadota bacterium]
MKNLKRLWSLMRGERHLYIFAIIAVAVAALVNFVWPLVLRITVDNIIGKAALETKTWIDPLIKGIFDGLGGREHLSANLWICGLILVILAVVQGLSQFLKGKWSASASENIAKNIRNRLYDHIQKLPFSYHQKVETGDLIQRSTSDIETVRRMLAMQLVEIGRTVFMFSFAMSFMLPMSWKLTLMSMVFMPFIMAFSFIFYRRIRNVFEQVEKAESKMHSVIQENVTGVRVVRAFAAQNFEIGKFEERNGGYTRELYRMMKHLAMFWSFSDLLCGMQMVLVISIATWLAATGKITLGTMMAFSSYIGMLIWPFRSLGRILVDVSKSVVSIGRIDEILQEAEEDLGSAEGQPVKGDIEFNDVWFGYDAEKPVLKGVSLKIKAGETVAFLGATGSGKSSLVHLLPRLYEYQKGSILIDGKELKDMDKHYIRRNIGIVLQEPFLFSRSIEENIGIREREFSREGIVKAAEQAAVHEVINEFDKGYETLVGERGVTLSGGQKQRIAMARTLLQESPILIFDDSLSAVDTETDRRIRERLRERQQQVTTIIISHRLTTISEADRIYVLEEGKITQSGTHQELILQPGIYQRIWKIQSSFDLTEVG